MVNHRDNFVLMLDESKIDYCFRGGDGVLVDGVLFQFNHGGMLKEIINHDGGDEDDFY